MEGCRSAYDFKETLLWDRRGGGDGDQEAGRSIVAFAAVLEDGEDAVGYFFCEIGEELGYFGVGPSATVDGGHREVRVCRSKTRCGVGVTLPERLTDVTARAFASSRGSSPNPLRSFLSSKQRGLKPRFPLRR
jgi:hypothetical protein